MEVILAIFRIVCLLLVIFVVLLNGWFVKLVTKNADKQKNYQLLKFYYMKKILFILSISFIFATACTNAKKNNTNTNSSTTADYTPQGNKKSNEAVSNELFNKLMEGFTPDWMEREFDPSIYPIFYAGSFINDQGKFVIAVTENNEQNRKALADLMGSDDFIIQEVEYSYADLLRIMNKIDEFLANSEIANDNPALVNFAGAYPDVVDNRVRVTFLKVNDDVISAFKNDVSNSPAIIFEEGERHVLH